MCTGHRSSLNMFRGWWCTAPVRAGAGLAQAVEGLGITTGVGSACVILLKTLCVIGTKPTDTPHFKQAS